MSGFGEYSGDDNSQKNKESKFYTDITELAAEGKLDPVFNRDDEVNMIAEILSRRSKNNPLIVGEPGTGKTTLVNHLANLINKGQVPRKLIDAKILSLDLTSVVAGTKYRGQFEERIKGIIEEAKKDKNIILFIDEIHTIVGAGSTSGSLDAANILKPALSSGEIRVIGATTIKEYTKEFEKDGALNRRFQKVHVNPPNVEETIDIINKLKHKYEQYHKVKYSDEIIEKVVKLSDRYITDKFFPDKAIDVIDIAGSSSQLNIKTPTQITAMEEKIEAVREGKKSSVKKQNFEEAALKRDEERNLIEELNNLKAEWHKKLDSQMNPVSEETILKVVSKLSRIPIEKIDSKDKMNTLSKLDTILKNKVIGQDKAVEMVANSIKRNSLGLRNPNKPTSVNMFVGVTGTGKSLLAKTLAKEIFGSEDNLVRIDMGEYSEQYSVSKLIGSAPGYVGHDNGGLLTEKVRNNPYSVVLLDEIEKAHPSVFNTLLPLLDEGHITDSVGRKVDFTNTIIIMTSNVGVKKFEEMGPGIGFGSQATSQQNYEAIINDEMKKKFSPEFLNRIDEVILFNRIDSTMMPKIVDLELGLLTERIKEAGYEVSYSPKLKEYLAEHGLDEKYGARPLKRLITREVENTIADTILSRALQKGSKIKMGITNGKIDVK